MAVINFTDFKNNKTVKNTEMETKIEETLNLLKVNYEQSGIPNFDNLDEISSFIDNVLTDEFFDFDVKINLSKSDKHKMINLIAFLPKKIEHLSKLVDVGSEVYNEFKNKTTAKGKLDEISNLSLEMECKIYQFNELLTAYDTRFSKLTTL